MAEDLVPWRSPTTMSRSSNRSLGVDHCPGIRSNGLRSSWPSPRGSRSRPLAFRTQCDPSTVWRICRRYEVSGLPELLRPPQRTGRPARISPPATRPDRSAGLPGADRQGLAHHPLDEPGSGPPSGRRWDRPGHQRSDDPSDPRSGGPPAASHSVLEDVSDRRPVQAACREDPLVLRQRRAVGPAGLLGGLCR